MATPNIENAVTSRGTAREANPGQMPIGAGGGFLHPSGCKEHSPRFVKGCPQCEGLKHRSVSGEGYWSK